MVEEAWGLPPVTLTAHEMAVDLVLLELAEQAGVSVVTPESAPEAVVTVDFRGLEGGEAFRAIAKRLGRRVTYRDGVVEFEDDDGAAGSMGIFRVGHGDPGQAAGAMQAAIGSGGKVMAMGSMLIVAGGREHVERAERVSRFLGISPDGWRLDVRVVTVSDSFRRELGIDWTLGASLGATVGASAGDATPVQTGLTARAVVEAVARASAESDGAALLHTATLYVLEDGEARMHQGDRTPIPRYQTSPEGTVVVVGYEYVMTGFELVAKARRVAGGVRLQLEPSVSSVKGLVGDAPVVSQSRVTADVVLDSGEWVVISGLSTSQGTQGNRGIPGVGRVLGGSESLSASSSSVMYLIKADRVYAGGNGGGAEQ